MEQKTEMEHAVSEQQRRYIYLLARSVGLKVDVKKIETREQASAFIDRLKQMNATSGNKNPVDWELKDRKTAFGMATKLVFVTHAAREKDISKWSRKKFWDEVRNFYADYVRQQELVVVGNRME